MAYTLSNLIRDALDEMGQMTTVLATGGSTTTAVDANANGVYGDDADALQNGTLFVIRDAGGASAAPEGEMQRISDYDGTTITVGTAFTTAVASGDTVGIGSSQFPLQTCIQFANRAMQSFGRMPLVDKATIIPAAAQSEYAWSVAWKHAPPYRIDIQGHVNQTADNQWIELARSLYDVEPAVPGTAGLLIFHGRPPIPRAVRVHYYGIHPTLNAYSDPLDERIHPSLAIAALKAKLIGWFVMQQNGKDNYWREALNKAENDLEHARQLYPIWKPSKKAKIFSLGHEPFIYDNYTDPSLL